MEYSTIIKTNLNHLVNETAKFIKKKKFNSRRTFDSMYYNLVISNQHKKNKTNYVRHHRAKNNEGF